MHKQPKNYKGSSKKFIVQFGMAGLVVSAYFAAMLSFSLMFISNIGIITDEMNVLAQAESYYSFAQNVQREMIYNAEKPILGRNSFEISKDTIEQVYRLNQLIMDYHFHNKKILRDDYKHMFTKLYEDSLCDQTDTIKLDLIPFHCAEFIAMAP